MMQIMHITLIFICKCCGQIVQYLVVRAWM